MVVNKMMKTCTDVICIALITIDEEGTIEFKGLKFSMKEQVVEVRV